MDNLYKKVHFPQCMQMYEIVDDFVRLEEMLYRTIVFSENDITCWVSPNAIKDLLTTVYEAFKTLEQLNPKSGLITPAKSEIANLIHDYGHYVSGNEIGIVDRLKLALELAVL